MGFMPPFGHIEVICGCMFSGKTELLISRINQAKSQDKKIVLFKPALDVRYDATKIVSHNNTSVEALPIEYAKQMIENCEGADVVGIDEAQFFDIEIVSVVNQLANSGKIVIIAGLDMDYKGNPFGPMPQLLAVAEYVTKLKAKCAISGSDASFSYKFVDENTTIALGSSEKYEPRSRPHFFKN